MRLELRVIKRLNQRKLKALHVKVSLQNMAFFFIFYKFIPTRAWS